MVLHLFRQFKLILQELNLNISMNDIRCHCAIKFDITWEIEDIGCPLIRCEH